MNVELRPGACIACGDRFALANLLPLCARCEDDVHGYLQSFGAYESGRLDVIEERTAHWLRMVKQAVTQ